jgi:hypothetical protein
MGLLSGSGRPRPFSHARAGPVADQEQIAVTLRVRRKPGAGKLPDTSHWQSTPIRERKFFTTEEYVRGLGAHSADIDSVAAFVRSAGMTVLRTHAGRRTVSILGSAARINTVFEIKLEHFEDPSAPLSQGGQRRTHRGFDGPVTLPAELAGLVTAVIGLDNRHLGRPTGALGRPAGGPTDPTGAGYPLAANLVTGPSYNFPNTGAADQTIGVIAPQPVGQPEMPPCYLISDINNYFNNVGLPTGYTSPPALVQDIDCTVGTTTYLNNPAAVTAITDVNKAPGAILELTQDITTAAAIAQGATIYVYFTEASEAGLVEFLNRVLVPDPGENQPSVLSFSFDFYLGDDALGGPEYPGIGSLSDTSSPAHIVDELLAEITAVGVNVFAALGDWGSDNWLLLNPTPPPPPVPPDGKQHVAFPQTDPSVTACGGSLLGTMQETTWSDAFSTTSQFGGSFQNTLPNSNFGSTGGGVSDTFPAPAYQIAAGITGAPDSAGVTHNGRGVPDVAGHVAYSGYLVNNNAYDLIGTSCVAPLYAGLAAVLRSALGVQLGAFNTILYALKDVAFNDITVGNNDSNDNSANVGSVISAYTGTPYTGTTPDAAYFSAGIGWDACTGLGSINGTKLLNGIASLLFNSNYYFQLNKGSFGLDEVTAQAQSSGTTEALYSDPTPFLLVLEGFTPNAVGNLVPTVNSSSPGVTVAVGAPQWEIGSQPYTPQRVIFPCSLTFTSPIATTASGGIFPAAGAAATVLLTAPSVTVAGQILPAASANLILDPGADPYFANFGDNQYFYLSQDLRVFTVCPGILAQSAPIDGLALKASTTTTWDTAAAYTYIQDLLIDLNEKYSDPSGTNPFTLFPDQTNASSADSSVTPTQVDPAGPLENPPLANYNFAVARVRVSGAPNTKTSSNVRVLFRLFVAQTSDTDYQPTTTYPSTLDGAGQPQDPQLGVAGGEVVTIPFFATGNYEGNADNGINTDYVPTETVNNKQVEIGSSGQAWAYYGCYLNLYPMDNTITVNGGVVPVQSQLMSTHCCIVAQLVCDDAPYPTSGVVLGPEWSDNFAQRNLQITQSDNPGPPASHRVPQTFDIRPGRAPGIGQLEDYPDELMIDWGETPPGSKASIFWPQLKSADVLALANNLYSTHQLKAADAHTISCVVPKGITCVPIPPGGSANYAGLFTVDLPPGVRSGQTFTILVRRISTWAAFKGRTGKREEMRNWRYVVGSFAVRIPVTTPSAMLPAEENAYSILKWRLSQLPASSRWIPVLKRYLNISEGRIIGIGGNPGLITPSPYGVSGRLGRGSHGRSHESTGKVAGVIYDRFGDFEGFHLLTEAGHNRHYLCTETEIETLVRYAWLERVVITVVSEEHRREKPKRITLVRARRGPDQHH